jgi:hypothetical protein
VEEGSHGVDGKKTIRTLLNEKKMYSVVVVHGSKMIGVMVQIF